MHSSQVHPLITTTNTLNSITTTKASPPASASVPASATPAPGPTSGMAATGRITSSHIKGFYEDLPHADDSVRYAKNRSSTGPINSFANGSAFGHGLLAAGPRSPEHPPTPLSSSLPSSTCSPPSSPSAPLAMMTSDPLLARSPNKASMNPPIVPMTPPRISSLTPKHPASTSPTFGAASPLHQQIPASPPPSPPQRSSSDQLSPQQTVPPRLSSLAPAPSSQRPTNGPLNDHYPHPQRLPNGSHLQKPFTLEPSFTLNSTASTSTSIATSTPTPASSISSSSSAPQRSTAVDQALAALTAAPTRTTASPGTTASAMNRPRPSSYSPTKVSDVSTTVANMTSLATLPIPPSTSSLPTCFPAGVSATIATVPTLKTTAVSATVSPTFGTPTQPLSTRQQPLLQQQPMPSPKEPLMQPISVSSTTTPTRPAASVYSGSSSGAGASGAGGGYHTKSGSPSFGPPMRASTLDIRKSHTGSLLLGDAPSSPTGLRQQPLPLQQSSQPQQPSSSLLDPQAESSSRVRRRQVQRRNTYSADLATTSLYRSDDEMDIEELEAQRRKEALRKNSSRRISRRNDNDRVLIGTRIGEDHVNYVLMYNMLTGIRVSVSRCQAKLQRALVDEDFTSAHKLAFDITGNELTPSSKYDFKFKDYAPWVFRHLREDFHIDASDYLVSLTSKYILSELGSPGKSGSFFYFSQDYRFIIKTIHHAEHKFMRKILKDYFNHVKQNPHTLLCRFFGLHRVKLPHGRKIHFVVMGNVFPPNRDIHETYDMKGSTLGRAISDEELNSNPRATQKDLNWVNRNRKLELGPEKRHLFVEQTKRDVELLARLNIMDYSLLIGIHDIERGNRDNIRDNTLKMFQPDTSKKLAREPSRNNKRESKVNALRAAVKESDPQALTSSTLPSDSFSERLHCIFYADDGGLLSTNELNDRCEDLYYLGIIDILTPWNYVKKVEHYWKSLSQDKHAISAVNPKEYAQRFLSFMIHAIKVNHDVLAVLDKKSHPHSD